MPKDVQFGNDILSINNPCSILYQLSSPLQQYHHIQTLIKHYQFKTFNCKTINFFHTQLKQLKLYNIQYTVNINIQEPELKSAYLINQEMYNLRVTKESSEISAPTYVGFVRGLETFIQTLSCASNKKIPCEIIKLPIQITDVPEFSHRGIKIDSAKHYIPKYIILETIDAMMYNKMNVLHWSITDDDSFPLVLDSVPELAKQGAFSQEQVYTKQDVKEIVEYGMVRGVRIVPEISTPAHTLSWVKSDQYKNIKGCVPQALVAGTGGFDIKRNNETIDLVTKVFKELLQMFPDKMIHLGGKPQHPYCLNDGQGINYNQQYRTKQKQILKQLDNNRTYIYYDSNLTAGSDDVIHYVGSQEPPTHPKVIYSHINIHDLSLGVGNKAGYSTGGYSVWMEIYMHKINDDMIGAEMLLQSETSNEYTHHIKLWMRSSTLAQRLWNSKCNQVKPQVMGRIIRHQRIMDRRGIASAPITGQICQINPQFC